MEGHPDLLVAPHRPGGDRVNMLRGCLLRVAWRMDGREERRLSGRRYCNAAEAFYVGCAGPPRDDDRSL